MSGRRALAAWAVVAVILAAGGCAAHHELGASEPSTATGATSSLLKTRCGGCHAVPDPTSMSAEKWTAALERMKKRMALPAAEWDSLAAMAGQR